MVFLLPRTMTLKNANLDSFSMFLRVLCLLFTRCKCVKVAKVCKIWLLWNLLRRSTGKSYKALCFHGAVHMCSWSLQRTQSGDILAVNNCCYCQDHTHNHLSVLQYHCTCVGRGRGGTAGGWVTAAACGCPIKKVIINLHSQYLLLLQNQ